jgi:hypothetical protein
LIRPHNSHSADSAHDDHLALFALLPPGSRQTRDR